MSKSQTKTAPSSDSIEVHIGDPVTLDDAIYQIGNLSRSLGFLTRVVNIQLNDFVRSKADLFPSPATGALLSLVAANPGIRQTQAARILLVKQPNIAALVKKLADAGLLSSGKSSAKRSGLWITDEGLKLISRSEALPDLTREYADGLSDKEYHQLVALLRRLYRNRL